MQVLGSQGRSGSGGEREDRRDQIAFLRQLAVDQLKNYSGGFAGLERVTRRVDSIIGVLQNIADRSWGESLFQQWGGLEIIYAVVLADERHQLTPEEEIEVRGIVTMLLADFEDCEVPLYPEDNPEEGDVVRLRRSLPEHNRPAGSTGTVVVDYAKFSGVDAPLEYEVEFAGSDAETKVLVTLTVDDIEIVPPPRYGNPTS